MHIRAPQRLEPVAPINASRSRRRAVLAWMAAGSVLLHVLVGAALLLFAPDPPEADEQGPERNEVAVVFDSPGAAAPSVKLPDATAASAPAPGVAEAVPLPDATPRLEAPSASAQPPPETTPVPDAPPVQQASIPAPEVAPTPSPPTSTPPVEAPRPSSSVTVSLAPPAPSGDLPPAFTPPIPPLELNQTLPPLPAPPRAPPQQRVAPSTAQRAPSFPTPQDWSFNGTPSNRSPANPRRGFDTTVPGDGGQTDAKLGYVRGARPTGDWMGGLQRWARARLYYPEQAIAERQQGSTTLNITIARSGKVLAVELVSSSRSVFLDGAWLDIWRNATVPGFTPEMEGDSTTITYTLNYILRGPR